jgi:hypothetical protein
VRIASIELMSQCHAGRRAPEVFATIRRRRGEAMIEVTITSPGGSRTHHVQADDPDDQWSMAQCLQETLDGHIGSNSTIHEYFREIQRLGD